MMAATASAIAPLTVGTNTAIAAATITASDRNVSAQIC